MEKAKKMTCVKDYFMVNGKIAFKNGVEYEYEKDAHGSYYFKSEVTAGFIHLMLPRYINEVFGGQGEVSKSMGVDTKPAHKFEINGYWVMVDSKMPKDLFKALEARIKDYFGDIPF